MVHALPLVVLLLAGAASSPAPTDAAQRESWFVVRIAGSPVGFASESFVVEPARIVYRAHTDLSLTRMGTPLSMFMMAEEVTDAGGRFRSTRLEMNASVTGMRARGVLEDDSVTYEVETGGHAQRRRIPWEADAITQWQSERVVEAWLASDAPEVSFKVFGADDGAFKTMRLVRGERVTEAGDGGEVSLLAVREYEGKSDVPLSTTWFDQDGQPQRTVVRQMGMEISIERVSEEEMAAIELEPNFDIIRQSMIRCEGYPDPPGRVETVTVRLDLPHPLPAGRDLEGPNQKLVGRGEDWFEVMLTRETILRRRLADAERAAYLEPGPYIQSSHPRVRVIADSLRAATGAEGWELGRVIAAWVGGYIHEKGFGQGFASALEVLSTRSGDCTEHAVLLTAVLRAAGLPARPAVGLAYTEGSLVGHMWTEVYDGYWRTLDALDLDGDPIRIRVTAAGDARAVDQRDLLEAYATVGGAVARVTGSTPR
ncbi:MAG: transglutaminase domain-containing protein [Candidatus Krumholzibacteria bacterium]|nr:transglutaminase domain-containing protein [Candidatus Krumholzibacteria bacterium]